MKKSPLKVFFIILVLSFFSLRCTTNPVSGQKEIILLSEKDEIKLAKEWYPNILWSAEGAGGEFKDDKLKAYLRDLVLQIHRVSHRPHLPIEFVIQNSSLPNAWAIPGYVAITRGLLCALESEAEFVYVMGHEIGHISARHSASQMSKSILADSLLKVGSYALSGKSYADWAMELGSIGANLLLLKYSREDELEADRLGVEYMVRLGYDPKNAIYAHLNVQRASDEYLRRVGKDSEEGSFFSELLSTHPRTKIRIEELKTITEKVKPVNLRGDGTQRKIFQEAISNLKRTHRIYITYYDPAVSALRKGNIKEAERLIDRALEEKNDEAPYLTLKGILEQKRGRHLSAEGYFRRAQKIDPSYVPALRGLGIVCYEKKDLRNAMAFLKDALSLFPNDVPSHYYLGMAYFDSHNYHYAINHLEFALQALPEHPTIYGTLGICYEKTGKIHKAYEYYLKQVKVAPDNEMGRYAKDRLRSIQR